jgi:ABC-type multidrug transport system permease subunit
LTGRPILEKHKQYALYRPSAFYVAQVIMDVPYAIAQGTFKRITENINLFISY